MISIPSIPDSLRTPGAYIDFNTRAAIQGLPDNAQSVLLIGVKTVASIGGASFSGSGLNDLTSGGTFTGLVRRLFKVVIETAGSSGTPGTFKWSKDGGRTWDDAGVTNTGAAQDLLEGVTITFGATYGQTEGESWTFYAEPPGTQAALAPVQIYSVADAKARFGAGSQLHLMAQAAYTANPYTALHCIALDAAEDAVAAAIELTAVPGGVAGALTLWVGNKSVAISVAADDTAAIIYNKLAGAVNAQADLPVRATVTADTSITLTCNWGGSGGNEIAISYKATNNCAALTITEQT